MTVPPGLQPLLPDHELYEEWFEKHGLSWRQVEAGEPCVPVEQEDGSIAKEPITLRQIEEDIAKHDLPSWAFLNLVEREGVRDPEDPKKWFVQPGDPWDMFPIQKTLARISGRNLLVECGSEVGKTRDIVAGSLQEADTATGGEGSLIAADSDNTLEEIWEEIRFQLEQNPNIGRGVKRIKIKPFRTVDFHSGFRLQLRICGPRGQQFRGAHITKTVRADEVAMWKNPKQLTELFRAKKPGSFVRIYSTPDGDYSSPFYALCNKAKSIDQRQTAEDDGGPTATVKLAPNFVKINITKMDLPYPFWSERRAEEYRDEYGGEHSLGWITNVLGAWGSPQRSIFPWELLEPLLKYIPEYRIATARLDTEALACDLNVARLDPAGEDLDRDPEAGAGVEIVISRERIEAAIEADVARQIADTFPDISDMADPRLFFGGDVGSAQDPSEFICQRVIGVMWRDLYRLHIEYASWTLQTEIIRWLDCRSGHRAQWSIDNGSAGAFLIQALCEDQAKAECPNEACGAFVEWRERFHGRGFGEAVDEIDIDTGELVLNPDKKDRGGNALPFRWINKEWSTRILERKAYKREMAMAHDAGAGDQRLSGPQLLTNHTMTGANKKGERQFKDKDSHHADARRQAALAIIAETRDPGPPDLNSSTFRTTGVRPTIAAFDSVGIATGPVVGAMDSWGVGSVRRGVRGGGLGW